VQICAQSLHRTLTRRPVDAHPNGYPRLAAILNSDENFLICRKYGVLHSRVLLYRQDELRELEKELYIMDQVESRKDGGITLQSRAREERNGVDRRDLIERIDNKLKEYSRSLKRR
jgi:hypothetical protein